MVDDLSALGLRHVGYGVPIELFGPFTDSCVEVMKPLIEALPTGESSKMILCPADRAHELPECELSKHLTLEGFRWSIGLVSRVLVRTIIEGSTAVMQAIHQDDSKRLRRALREAPRSERFTWQLSIRVGSQSISPLYWALRSGAHSVAKTLVIQDVLTIRADRDRYYYGVNDLFRLQPDVVENILREAPHLAEILLDGLIWRSHKTQDGWRPVIYYLEHMLQDMDENKMISRALKSLVRFNHPKTIMHPILTFTLDLLWDKLAMRFFVSDRILTLINFLIFLLSGCYLNQLEMEDARASAVILACARALVYFLGFGKLLYSHTLHIYKSLRDGTFKKVCGVDVPQYLTQGPEFLSFLLMLDMICMIVFEPMIRCLGSEEVIAFKCTDLTGDILFAYEVFVIVGIFIYTILVLEVGSISIKLSEYRVLCLHAIEQVVLCVGAVFIAVCTFSFAMAAATHEVGQLSAHEWSNMGSTMGTLVQMCAGVMDLQVLHSLGDESPFLLILVVVFMLLVYSSLECSS
ncbi:Retrovirus-related Pol polyprotein from transposon TNT 1-94, partial [Durusdinium trenchii]